MREPSVKGIVFVSAVERVRELLDAERLEIDDAMEILEPRDLHYLKSPVLPTLWYPVGLGGRYVELLWEVEGGRQREYLLRRGHRAAERIFGAGLYANMMSTAEHWGGEQIVRALLNIAAQFYNFMRWEPLGSFDDDRYGVEVHGATDWPDVLRVSAEGFMESIHSREKGVLMRVTSERPTPDRVVFTIAKA